MEISSGIKRKISTKEMILCSLFAALIAIGAFIKVPLPYVPFTMQLMFTTLAGILLGSRLGAMSTGIYIAIGLIGIPVFTKGGGIGYIFQPTFGYLVGFMAGSYLTGKIVEIFENPRFFHVLGASLAGLFTVYLIGVPYLYMISNFMIDSPLGVKAALTYGMMMFIPGDITTCIICGFLGKKLVPIIRRQRRSWN